MSDYDAGLTLDAPAITPGGIRLDPKPLGLLVPEAGTVTTYYYRATDGSRGSTTDAGAVPAGAVVERRT